jgi:hypothetical protein
MQNALQFRAAHQKCLHVRAGSPASTGSEECAIRAECQMIYSITVLCIIVGQFSKQLSICNRSGG